MTHRASKQQQKLLEYIDDFIKAQGFGPSYREIMAGLGYKSVSTVATHVDGLIARGYLRKKGRSARSLEVVTLREVPVRVAVARPTLLSQLEAEIEARQVETVEQTEGAAEEIATLSRAAVILGTKKRSILECAQRKESDEAPSV